MYYHRGICTVGAIDFLQKVDTNWLLAMLTKPLLLVVTSCTCEQVGWRDYQKYTIVLGREFVSSADVFHLESGGLGTTTDHWNTSTGSGGYACAAVGDDLHHIGGHCGHRSCYHNGVHKLSTSSLQWVMLSPTTSEDDCGAPMKKAHCGMEAFKDKEEDMHSVCSRREWYYPIISAA